MKKGHLVLAVIESYVSKHPSIDISELLNIFPKDIQGSIGVLNDFEFVKEKYGEKNHKRHFIRNNEVIKKATQLGFKMSQQSANNFLH